MKRLALFFAFSVAASAQYISPLAPPPFASDPATCYVGQLYLNTVTSAVKLCTATNTWSFMALGPGSSTNNYVPQWNGTGGFKLAAGLPVTAAGPAGGGAAAAGLAETLASGYLDASLIPGTGLIISNDTGTGTTLLLLAKISSTGKAIKAGTTDTAVPVFIVVGGAGTSGQVVLAANGTADCTFDAAGGTAGHFVSASTATAGRCMDAGASWPSSGWVIGQLTTSPSANASGTVALLNGDYAASGGGGGSVTSIGFTTPVSGFTFTSNTTNPITSTGTVTLGFSNESAGVAFIGPCTGSATTPTWRALCYQDVPGAVNTVSFSTTPTFDFSLGGIQKITLTANVASSSISNGSAGKLYTLVICQDGTGAWTFSWPSGVTGNMTIGSTASKCSSQTFAATAAATFVATAPGVINQ